MIIDADGSYPVKFIPKMLDEYIKGFDCVIFQRDGKYFRENFFKSFLRKILGRIVNFVASDKILDINSGFRVFKKEIFLKYYDFLCDRFSLTTTFSLFLHYFSYDIKYIKGMYEKRVGITKVKLFNDTIYTFQYILQTLFIINPLKFFFLLSVIFVFCSIILIILATISKIKAFYYVSILLFILIPVFFAISTLAVLLNKLLTYINKLDKK